MSYFTDCYQFVHIEFSTHTKVKFGVQQDSVLTQPLFSLFMLPLGNIFCKHCTSFYSYAQNTESYVTAKPDERYHIDKVEECVKDI